MSPMSVDTTRPAAPPPSGDPRGQELPRDSEADGHPPDRQPEAGNRQEDVEDRPNVSTVKPEDYPAEERKPL